MLSVCVFGTKTGFMCITFTRYTHVRGKGSWEGVNRISLWPWTEQSNE